MEPLYTNVCDLLQESGLHLLDPHRLFVECPGIHLHTTPNRESDCKAYWTPKGIRLHCFHQSCGLCVCRANVTLDRYMRWGHAECASAKAAVASKAAGAAAEELRQKTRDAKQGILRDHLWPHEAIVADSPEKIDAPPRYHYLPFFTLFDPMDNIWIGRHIGDTGKLRHRSRFRHAVDWAEERSCPGMYTCPNTFNLDVYSRSNENVSARKFLVVESDTLNRDQVGAIFRWLEQAKGMRLRAVVDTAGKSLHGWFDYPPRELASELQIILPELGCDPAMFKPAQPCRLPGALRNGKYQTLIYLNL